MAADELITIFLYEKENYNYLNFIHMDLCTYIVVAKVFSDTKINFCKLCVHKGVHNTCT